MISGKFWVLSSRFYHCGSGHFELVDALACWRFLQSSGAPPFFIFLNRIFTIFELLFFIWYITYINTDPVARVFKVGVNPSLKKEMWLLMHLITKRLAQKCTKVYISGIRKTRWIQWWPQIFVKLCGFLEIYQ